MRVVHLIHSAKVGGVEAAAARLRRESSELSLRLAAFAGPADPDDTRIPLDAAGRGLNSPRSVLILLRYLRAAAPEVLVTSLWRSVALGLLTTPLLPGTRWAVFVHNCRYTNPLDRLVHRLAFRRADAVFCDSAAARDALVPARVRARIPVTVIEPVGHTAPPALPSPVTGPALPAPAPMLPPPARALQTAGIRLIFWGRLARQKRLDRAVGLLAALSRASSRPVTFDIIGPDEGQLPALLTAARSAGVQDRLRVHGPQDWASICRLAAAADFFVQLSDFEGHGMSVREAMQLGLIPVVTPVGEIGTYARDGVNAVLTTRPDDHGALAARLIALREDPAAMQELAAAARACPVPDFVAAFADSCRKVAAR